MRSGSRSWLSMAWWRPASCHRNPIRRLRNLTRYRVQLMGDRTRDATRLEKLLEDASIKLSAVASSVTTVSARQMLAALVAGERDPQVMAELAKSRMRRKIPELTEALTGHFDDHHALLVGGDAGPAESGGAGTGRAGRANRCCDGAVGPSVGAAETIPGVGLKTAQVIIAETGARHVSVPVCSASGGLGRGGAGDARVRR
jgi:transposase